MRFSPLKFINIVLISICLVSSFAYAQEDNDPLESVNRKIFWFNDKADHYVLEPISEGYDYITPQPVQNGISNFFSNLKYPVEFVGDLLQLKFSQAAEHTGRFAINTTVGLLGFMDIAEDWGLEEHSEDIGIAFGNWGIPGGPYLVLPLLGPSNLRDGVGLVGEAFLSPTAIMTYSGMNSNDVLYIGGSLTALDTVQRRNQLADAIDSAKESSVDYYLFVRSAYHQHREGLIYDKSDRSDKELLDDDDIFLDD